MRFCINLVEFLLHIACISCWHCLHTLIIINATTVKIYYQTSFTLIFMLLRQYRYCYVISLEYFKLDHIINAGLIIQTQVQLIV